LNDPFFGPALRIAPMNIIRRLKISDYDKRVVRAHDLAETWLAADGLLTDRTLAVATECAGDAGLLAMMLSVMMAENYHATVDLMNLIAAHEITTFGIKRA
jgi:hypothetical protein